MCPDLVKTGFRHSETVSKKSRHVPEGPNVVQTESRHSQDRSQRELRKILGLALVSGFDLVLVWDKVRKNQTKSYRD